MNFEFEEKDLQRQTAWRALADEELARFAAGIDETGRLPDDLPAVVGERELLRPFLPTDLGGEGLGLFQLSVLLEEVGRHSPATALLLAQQVVLGIRLNGRAFNFASKNELAKAAASAKALFSIAATEREAGCDLGALSTVCRKLPDGAFEVTGGKAYVNWAGRAAYIVVLARAEDAGDTATSLFAIPRETAGIQIGNPHQTMGMNGLEAAPVSFDKVRLAPESLIGAYGFGLDLYDQLMDELRIAVAAIATGLSQQVYDDAAQHAKGRKQFGKPIGSFQSIQWRFADAALRVEASRLHVWRAVEQAGGKGSSFVQTAIAKVYCTEAAFAVADFAVQAMGSQGY
ncbi:MAG TPA: acyl-CoA dehydrogenase family protein, partial [Candidatus Ozemobacteraceae bacterium]|nr:acyl-CoA dehydrogenase family protein [Candidatus Ozemobacteraceae bacterium]